MGKGWKFHVLCGCLAVMTAGIWPMAALGDELSGLGIQGPGTQGLGAQTAGAEEDGALADAAGEAGEGADQAAEVDKAMEEAMRQEAQLDAYFDGSVFIGDSVMQGYGDYAMRRGGSCLGRMQFLAEVSFSVFNALRPVTAKSTHPTFMGQKRYVWESAGMLQPKRVFLFFGLNDIDMGPLESTCARYAQVIANIKTYCPEAEIHIMGMTYIRPAKARGRLNNPTIRQFNGMLAQMALDNGWGYVNVADAIADGNGDLAAGYCSDGDCHLTSSAYDVWTAVLRDYARAQMDGTSAFPVNGQGAGQEEETQDEPGGEGQNAASGAGQGASGGAGQDPSAGAGQDTSGGTAQDGTQIPKVIRSGQEDPNKGPGTADGE